MNIIEQYKENDYNLFLSENKEGKMTLGHLVAREEKDCFDLKITHVEELDNYEIDPLYLNEKSNFRVLKFKNIINE